MEKLPQGNLAKRLDEENAIRTASTPPTQGRDEENVIYVRFKLPRVRWLLSGLAIAMLAIAALLPSTPGLAQESMVNWGRNSYVLIRGHSDMVSPLTKMVELGNEVKSKEATIAAQNEERERLLSQLHATEDVVNQLTRQLRATEDVVNERTSALTSTQSSLKSTQSQLGTTQSQLGTTQGRLSETQSQLERNARLIQAYDNLFAAWDQLGFTMSLMIDTGLKMWDAARTDQWVLANYYVGEYNRLVASYNRLAADYRVKLQALRSLF